MFDDSIFFDLISISMVSSIISTQVIHKVKTILKLGSLFNNILALFISFWIGFIYSQSFYDDNFILSLWIGLFTVIGSENFYKVINTRNINKK